MLYGDSIKRKSIVMYKFLLFVLLGSVFLGGCTNNCLTSVGEEFVGAPYLISPLGEGFLPDDDPLIRFDAFDCTTFVETVMANCDEKELNQIRYKNGKIGFLERNHFIESDWLINNADKIKNVSEKFGLVAQRNVVIDKKSWLKKVHNIDADFAPMMVNIDYLPYSKVAKIKSTNELIVLFVADNPEMRDKIGTDLAVVHMGFLLPNGMLRHASSEMNVVVDVDFYQYLKKCMKNKNNLGIVLLEIIK